MDDWDRFVEAARTQGIGAARDLAEEIDVAVLLKTERWFALDSREQEQCIDALFASTKRREWTTEILRLVAEDLHALFDYSNSHMDDDSIEFSLGFFVDTIAARCVEAFEATPIRDDQLADEFAAIATHVSHRFLAPRTAGNASAVLGSERHAWLLFSALVKDAYEERARALARIPSLATLVLLMRADGDPSVRELPWQLSQVIKAVCPSLREENPQYDRLEQESRRRWYQYWISTVREYLYIEMRDPTEHTFRYQVRVQTDWQSRGVVPRMIWPDDPAYGSPSFPTWRFEEWNQHKHKHPYYRWNTMDEAVRAGHIEP